MENPAQFWVEINNCLQVCGVDHYGLLFTMFGREAGHHPSEMPFPLQRLQRVLWCP